MQVAGHIVALALGGLTAWPSGSAAQAITADGTMGTTVGNVGNAYTINGGTVRGNNLFHSFSQFSVPTSGGATFNGPLSTANVLSRVTGEQPSSIDGRISTRAAMPNANFFLINPNGVVFGPNASLNVGGAFRVSTADSIVFPDAVFFAKGGTGDAVLSSLAPQAFGFLSGNPASIKLDGAVLVSRPGQTLSIVGGDVELNGAFLQAPGGLVQVVSVGSAGSVDLNAPDLANFPRAGCVSISGSSTDFGVVGGTVVIRSGQLTVEGGAFISSNTARSADVPVRIDLRVTDSMIVRKGSKIQTDSTGPAGDILITGGKLTVTGVGSGIESQGLGSGGSSGVIKIRVASADILDGGKIETGSHTSVGNVTIVASDTLTVAGLNSEISSGTLADDPSMFGGDISLTVGDLVLRDQGTIRSGGAFEQAGERVTINASNAVSISSLAGIASQSDATTAGVIDIATPRLAMDAGYINTSTLGTGGAGQVLINANTVALTNGAQIASSSQIKGTGAGGSITVNAPGSISISGVGPADGVGSITFTGVPNSGIFSTTERTGNAGHITLMTPVLTLADGGRISVATKAAGDAGKILATVGNFSITGGARVDSSTSANGAGGAITVNGTLAIAGAGSGLFSTASSTGNAGAISVTAPNVTVSAGGTIDSSTTAAGAGGEINITAATEVQIANGGSVRADSHGTGNTGSITIAAGDRIVMEDGSISTHAATSDGGNITLTAPSIIKLEDSLITTSVESGGGGGGNISIDPQFVVLQGSAITANAFGGPGGNITIVADNFVADSTTVIQASSALSTPGTVRIQSPENNLQAAIAQLPGGLLDASRLLRAGCAARHTGAPSAFVVAGRGGVPPDADGYLPSFSVAGAPPARVAAHDQGFVLGMTHRDCTR